MNRELDLYKLRDVVIFPFFECNLRCKHCFVSKPKGEIGLLKSNPENFSSHISPDHVRRIAEWGAKIYTILGGEPFLSSALPEMVKILREAGQVAIYSNGVLLAGKDKKELGFLENLDFLVLSLEGDKYWTERIRGKVFEKVLDVVQRGRELTNVSVRMSYWDETVHIGKEKRVRDQMYSVVKMVEFLNDNDIPVMVAPRLYEPPPPREKVEWLYKTLSTYPMVDCLLPSYKNFIGLGITCPAGWKRIVILPNGDVACCQWNLEEPAAKLSWRDEWIEEFCTEWRRNWIKLKSECSGCKFLDKCQSSCRMARDYKTCPVKKVWLDGKMSVEIEEGEVRETSRSFALSNLRKLVKLTPLVC